MTARLSATERHVLERGRRWLIVPSPQGLPRAYTSLLRDPSDVLDTACGSLLTNVGSVTPPPAAARTFRQRADALAEPTALQHQANTQGSVTTHAPLYQNLNRAALPATPATSRHANARPPGSPVPINLPVASRVRPSAGEASHAVGSSHPSLSPAEAGGVSAREIRPAPPSSVERSRAGTSDLHVALPIRVAPETSPAPLVSAVAPFRTSGPNTVTEASGRTARARQSFAARHRTDDTAAHGGGDGERAFLSSPENAGASSVSGEPPPPVVHFAHSTSRLAAVLNANLVPPAPQPDDAPESVEAFPRARAERPQRIVRDEADEPPSVVKAKEEGEHVSVEAMIEELYERLHLEFLRTYGTSGE